MIYAVAFGLLAVVVFLLWLAVQDIEEFGDRSK